MTVFFAIACIGRTGSTMLASMLDSHPDIECRGELFGPDGPFQRSGLTRAKFLDEAAYVSDRPIKGFKVPFDWAIVHPGIYDDSRERNYRIIHLARENILQHYLSARLAQINEDWTSQQAYAGQTVTVDPWAFVEFSGFCYCATPALTALAAGLDSLDIRFEELELATTQQVILDFLGGRTAPLTARTTRARTMPDCEAIENYDALVRLFAGSPYGAYFPPKPQPADAA